ncbi:PRC-barrel domain-containing protein [Lutispora saccharofermentans]|uniref:PRC-barrel domain-containing protein n=1 Tax=Lutispora saccharofermentans TaxID=3024236 RepID=A0ABT1NFD5_9FIRM|nr:hypothetical protein [Lutispora saccharofermentans]MCQ1529779.1 hypothetical protein [Lutispora saccharofermentans]
MIRCSEILEKPIFNNKSKEMFSLVYDVILKKNSNKILGFVWRRKILKKEFSLILYNDLLSVNKDGLYVKSSYVPHDFDYNNSLYFGLSYKHDFSNKIVLNRDNELIGIIRDALLDMETGSFTCFEFSEGYIDDIFTGRKLIAAGSGYKIDSNAVTLFYKDIVQEQGRGLLNMNKLI